MGISITITEEVIAKACRVAANGRFIWNANRNHPFLESYKGVVLKETLPPSWWTLKVNTGCS